MDIRGFLQDAPLFSEALGPGDLDALAAAAKVVAFEPGAVVIRERDSGDSMFVVVSGKLSVAIDHQGSDKEVATLEPGQVFGEMSLLTGVPRLATVTAVEPVEAIEVTKAAMKPVLTASPELYDRLAEVLYKRQGELDRIYDPVFWRRYGGARQNVASLMRSYFGGAR